MIHGSSLLSKALQTIIENFLFHAGYFTHMKIKSQVSPEFSEFFIASIHTLSYAARRRGKTGTVGVNVSMFR
jgi:hypothetical protein